VLDGGYGSDTFALTGDGDTALGDEPADGDHAAYGGFAGALGLPLTVDLAANVGGVTGSTTVDRIFGVSSAKGSSADDVLLGDGGPNFLAAIAGDDLLDGRGGFDRLLGGPGTDSCLNGEAQQRSCETKTDRPPSTRPAHSAGRAATPINPVDRGVIVGDVVGYVGGALVVVGAVWALRKRRRQRAAWSDLR
jgi:hypothetical protein